MKSTILGLLAETSIHPGAGQDTGFVDLPVAREAATEYPVIVGSSMKGALRDLKFQVEFKAALKEVNAADEQSRTVARRIATDRTEEIFGRQENAGKILVSDGRLVLLPVRSLTSQYKWVTCPHLLERLVRDLKRASCIRAAIEVSGPGKGQYIGVGLDSLYLEEREFKRGDASTKTDDIIKLLTSLIAHQETTAKRLRDQFVILHDDDFAWFARFGLAVNARNVLDDVTKTSRNLWYEEAIPPDSLFYCLIAERGDRALDAVHELFIDRPYLQVGGNETVGQGWMAIREWKGGAA